MRSVRINRAKWRAGQDGPQNKSCGIGDTLLVNADGFKCCLGFAAQQLSHKSLSLINACGEPEQLPFVVSPLNYRNEDNYMNNTELTDKAIMINDAVGTTLKAKEKALIKLFVKHDLELEFFGEYVHDTDA